MTTDQLIDDIITREGNEYTDDPADSGGPTKWGVTQQTLSKWRGYKVTKKEVQDLERIEAEAIFRHMFVARFVGILQDRVKVQIVDWYVNGGAAVKTLQRLVGVPADGIMGPKTMTAVNAANGVALARGLWQARLQHMATITRDSPKNRRFILGWVNRMIRLYPS